MTRIQVVRRFPETIQQSAQNAVVVETACVINVNVRSDTIQTKSFLANSVNATIFHAIETRVYCARVLKKESVLADLVLANQDGQEMHVTAEHQMLRVLLQVPQLT